MVKTTVRALLAAGILLSSVSAVSASKMTENVGHSGGAKRGVHTNATGVSGFAVVGADGTLARKLNAKTVTHDVGINNDYVVAFNSNIRGCAYTATIGLPGSSGVSDPGTVTVVGASENVKAVYVSTYDASGADAELPFHLLVTC